MSLACCGRTKGQFWIGVEIYAMLIAQRIDLAHPTIERSDQMTYYNVERLHGPLYDSALPPPKSDAPGPQETKLQPISGLLPKLLYERYGLLENPFGVTPNTRYL